MSPLTQAPKAGRCAYGVATLATVALLVAGCGGSGQLSHRALVTQADHACRTADGAVSRLGVPQTTLPALTRYAGRVLPISQQLARRLAALKPAASDTTKLDELVTAIQNGNQGLTLMARATSTAQTDRASQRITATSVPRAANALGAAGCASSPAA